MRNPILPRPDTTELARIGEKLSRVEAKLDEALTGLDFMRRRMSTYLGAGRAITYLADETPIYVNSNDFGPPANLISGGLYEADNLDVLLSFARDDSVALDIGANLGFFSLQLARRLVAGQVHAFEPHPELGQLLCASAYLNGFSDLDGASGRIRLHRHGVGDFNGPISFAFPQGHLGGGHVGATGANVVRSEMRRLDDVFAPDFVCDLMKIDVEGHELQALQGMKGVLTRSKDVKILFEKLGERCGYEADIEQLLGAQGFTLYAIGADRRLDPLPAGALSTYSGYVLGARDASLAGSRRDRFDIYPRQLFPVPAATVEASGAVLRVAGREGALLCHGPYWFLRQGGYEVTVVGDIKGQVELTVAARFGFPITTFALDASACSVVFAVPRDLTNCEFVFRAMAGEATMRIERIAVRAL